MAKADRNRRFALALAGLGGVVAATSPLWGGDVARRIPWLEVDRVEVSGTRLLAPHEVLAVSGIRRGNHLLDEAGPWEQALRGHPVIADARIERHAPNTLRIRVAEEIPVALVQDDVLRPATAAGEVLPVDPAAASLDLPIVHGSLEDPVEAVVVRQLLAETWRLTELDPGLMQDVSEVRAHADLERVLVMNHRLGEVVLPAGATPERLAQLRAVLAEIADRPSTGAAEDKGGGATQVDLRFGDQIVVRHNAPGEHS